MAAGEDLQQLVPRLLAVGAQPWALDAVQCIVAPAFRSKGSKWRRRAGSLAASIRGTLRCTTGIVLAFSTIPALMMRLARVGLLLTAQGDISAVMDD